MNPGSIVYVLALLVGAVIVVIVLLRFMKARARDAKALAPPPAAPEEDEYLDSSHILTGRDAAARAAEAARTAKDKRR